LHVRKPASSEAFCRFAFFYLKSVVFPCFFAVWM